MIIEVLINNDIENTTLSYYIGLQKLAEIRNDINSKISDCNCFTIFTTKLMFISGIMLLEHKSIP